MIQLHTTNRTDCQHAASDTRVVLILRFMISMFSILNNQVKASLLYTPLSRRGITASAFIRSQNKGINQQNASIITNFLSK